MVYIDKNKNTQVVYIPSHGYTPDASTVKLTARNTADGTEVKFAVASCEKWSYLLRMVIGLPECLAVGEWEYTLTDGEIPPQTGIMIVTKNSDAVMQYKRDITYKQYGE